MTGKAAILGLKNDQIKISFLWKISAHKCMWRIFNKTNKFLGVTK